MEFANLEEMMARDERKIDLFGTDNFRSWMLYFVPGDGTDMHYHASPETFLVFSGNGVVKGLKGEERPIKKNEVLCLAAKDYYQITNTGHRAFGAVRQPLRGLRRCRISWPTARTATSYTSVRDWRLAGSRWTVELTWTG